MNDTLDRSELFKPWVGQKCSDIVRYEYSWQFSFAPAGSVTIESLWRIIHDSRVVLCSQDDGQKFGLPQHVDAALEAYKLIYGKTVSAVVVENGDLTIIFAGDLRLQALVNSSGYESWNAACWSAVRNLNIVAVGSGELAIFEQPAS